MGTMGSFDWLREGGKGKGGCLTLDGRLRYASMCLVGKMRV